MTWISQGDDVVTPINVFTVAPENQQRLVDLLVEATEAVMSKMAGFVSANLHKSLDGTKVVNYAQWRSREAFEAMLENAEAGALMREAEKIATKIEPSLYKVSFVDEAPSC
jgi:quinol monooxygenase YgiN